LGISWPHHVVEHAPFAQFPEARGAADDDQGRFFGECPRDGVCGAEGAHGIGETKDTQPAEAGIGIGGVAGAQFVGGANQADRAFLHLFHEAEDIITRDAKDIGHPQFPQTADKVLRHGCF